MNSHAAENYLRIMELAKADPKYLLLYQDYQNVVEQLSSLFNRISEEERTALLDYIGTMQMMEMRLLEIAYLNMEFPDKQE